MGSQGQERSSQDQGGSSEATKPGPSFSSSTQVFTPGPDDVKSFALSPITESK